MKKCAYVDKHLLYIAGYLYVNSGGADHGGNWSHATWAPGEKRTPLLGLCCAIGSDTICQTPVQPLHLPMDVQVRAPYNGAVGYYVTPHPRHRIDPLLDPMKK